MTQKFKILYSRDRNKIETEINEYLQEGWKIVNCSATGSNIYAFMIKEV